MTRSLLPTTVMMPALQCPCPTKEGPLLHQPLKLATMIEMAQVRQWQELIVDPSRCKYLGPVRPYSWGNTTMNPSQLSAWMSGLPTSAKCPGELLSGSRRRSMRGPSSYAVLHPSPWSSSQSPTCVGSRRHFPLGDRKRNSGKISPSGSVPQHPRHDGRTARAT